MMLVRDERLPASVRSTLTTALMLQPDYDLFSAAIEAVDSGEVEIDSSLVLKLVQDYGDEGHRIVTEAPFARLPTRHFRPAFSRAWRRWSRSAVLRSRLALTLESFLGRNPGEGQRYRPLIRGLLFDSRHESALRGLAMVRYLAPMREDELQRLIHCSRSKSWEKRVNLALGIQWLLESKELSERAKKLSLRPSLVQALRRLTRDPNQDVRGAAMSALRLAVQGTPSATYTPGRARSATA